WVEVGMALQIWWRYLCSGAADPLEVCGLCWNEVVAVLRSYGFQMVVFVVVCKAGGGGNGSAGLVDVFVWWRCRSDG
ncbi:Hypothetical predicted protein, partial [Olea europaea subsp. europaea]